MAITINARPNEYDNHAIWNVTTDMVNDASHFNVRIESTAFLAAVAAAKKTKVLGLPVHDFTEVIRSFIQFTNPNPLNDAAGVNLNEGGKSGSNLITGLTNDGTFPFTVWTSATNVITTASIASAATARCFTNAITVVAGQIYVLECVTISIAGSNMEVYEKTALGCNRLTNGNSLGVLVGAQGARLYIQPQTSGTLQLYLQHNSSASGSIAGTFELWALNPCDWWAAYYMQFAEKYEDVNGVTQTGTTTLDSVLNLFFDVPSVTSTVFQNLYVCDSNANLFLENPSYDNRVDQWLSVANNYLHWVLPNKAAGNVCMYFLPFIVSRNTYNIATKCDIYRQNGTLVGTNSGSYIRMYQPIIMLSFDEQAVVYSAATYYRADIWIAKNNAGTAITAFTEAITDARFWPETFPLIWKNDKGGFATGLFLSDMQRSRKVANQQFMDGTNLSKTYDSIKKELASVKGLQKANANQMSFFKDILDSRIIFWHQTTGSLKPINITQDELLFDQNDPIVPTLSFEYIP